MEKLKDKAWTTLGAASMGYCLAVAIGGALVDRAAHPIDTWRNRADFKRF